MKRPLRRFVKGPLTDLAISVGHWLILALGKTWRVRHVGTERARAARETPGPVIYAFTHGVILPLVYTHRHRDAQVLISESRDGEIIARITGKLGFGAVRGSSTRGGDRAVIRLAAKGREGLDLAITPDGPRGPRGSVSPGTPVVASRSGLPVLPLGVSASRAYRAKSWDRFLVPWPFAEVFVVNGPPIRIRGRLGPEDLDRETERIARALEAVEAQATDLALGKTTAPEFAKEPA